MFTHVRPLLTAYVHGQLTSAQREQVDRHVRICVDCRLALNREERLARDLINFMPGVGESEARQMVRLWPAIWSELRAPLVKDPNRWPKFGMVCAIILLCVFVSSMIFTGSAQALAAPSRPLQFIPAEVLPTWTPARTDNPMGVTVTPPASETASALDVAGPMLSPPPSVKINR